MLFVCLFPLLGEDVNLDRAAEGESPRRQFPPFEEAWLRLWQLKVVTFYGERDRGGGVFTTEENRRELLLLEEEQGFSAEG